MNLDKLRDELAEEMVGRYKDQPEEVYRIIRSLTVVTFDSILKHLTESDVEEFSSGEAQWAFNDHLNKHKLKYSAEYMAWFMDGHKDKHEKSKAKIVALKAQLWSLENAQKSAVRFSEEITKLKAQNEKLQEDNKAIRDANKWMSEEYRKGQQQLAEKDAIHKTVADQRRRFSEKINQQTERIAELEKEVRSLRYSYSSVVRTKLEASDE